MLTAIFQQARVPGSADKWLFIMGWVFSPLECMLETLTFDAPALNVHAY